VAYLPVSADLHYLTGIPRDIPNFGRVMHPGRWLEGVWLAPERPPVLTVPRMSAEFDGLEREAKMEVRVLGDWDDPDHLVREILARFDLPPQPRIAVGDATGAETLVALQRLLPGATFLSATQILRLQRVVKEPAEIEQMRRAGALTEAAFAAVCDKLRPGMLELDVITEVDYQLRRLGSLGPSFTTSLYCSGPDHPLRFGTRQQTWRRPLQPPLAILFDFGAALDGYCYDFGRTVFMGEPPPVFLEIYELVMQSQAAGIAALRGGGAAASTAEEVDAAARQVIEAGGYGPAFRHRLGHGIGLDVHEPPFLTAGDRTTLQPGMLFTIEPSITQFHGFSARVEDVVAVSAEGGIPLTSGFRELRVVD
jgi:Xaa-Pro aminopeptidase